MGGGVYMLYMCIVQSKLSIATVKKNQHFDREKSQNVQLGIFPKHNI